MACGEALAARLRVAVAGATKRPVVEGKMSGGSAFMIDGKGCVGVHEKRLMVRVGPGKHEETFKEPGARTMDFTHRPMLGFLFIEAAGYRTAQDLDIWVKWSLDYTATVPVKKKGKS